MRGARGRPRSAVALKRAAIWPAVHAPDMADSLPAAARPAETQVHDVRRQVGGVVLPGDDGMVLKAVGCQKVQLIDRAVRQEQAARVQRGVPLISRAVHLVNGLAAGRDEGRVSIPAWFY